jgi:hypothetical protein
MSTGERVFWTMVDDTDEEVVAASVGTAVVGILDSNVTLFKSMNHCGFCIRVRIQDR